MASIQGIYVALFGRPADPEGLDFWTDLTNGGNDLSELLGRLTAEPEALERFEGLDSEGIVTLIYQSLFGREPEEGGLAEYIERLASGEATIETIAIQILDGATGEDKQIIDNKIAAADLFTASLDTPEEIAAYVGEAAADLGRAFVNQVTVDPESIPTQDEVDEQISEDFETPPPGGGQGEQPGGGNGGGSSGGASIPFAVTQAVASGDWQKVLEVLNEYKDDAFSASARLQFDQLPDGGGREKAIALAVIEHADYFGPYESFEALKETADFFTNTEFNKAEFISAVDGATTVEDMVEALGKASTLSNDRQDLIDAWEDSNSDAAQDRAEILKTDEYTVELTDVVDAGELELRYIAEKLLEAKTANGPYYGVVKIVDVIEDATDDIDGLTFADAAAGVTFEPSLDITDYIAEMAADNRLTDLEFDKVKDLVGSAEDAFRLIWDYGDDTYTANNTNPADGYYTERLNSFNLDLGILYAQHLKDHSVSELENIVKFTADGNNSGNPDREQTLHHNLLGNFDALSISDKFGPKVDDKELFTVSQIQSRIADAGLVEFLDRPIATGNEADPHRNAAAEAWDYINGLTVDADVDGVVVFGAAGVATGLYTTIQAAIDAAPEGSTVFVGADFYEETLVINKEVNLVGEGGAVIDGRGFGGTTTISLRADADGTSISGLTIYAVAQGSAIESEVGDIDGVTIRNNVLDGGTNTAGTVVYINPGADDLTIVGNTFEGASLVSSPLLGFETADAVVEGNNFGATAGYKPTFAGGRSIEVEVWNGGDSLDIVGSNQGLAEDAVFYGSY